VVLLNPALCLLADVPGGIVPHQQQRPFAQSRQLAGTVRQPSKNGYLISQEAETNCKSTCFPTTAFIALAKRPLFLPLEFGHPVLARPVVRHRPPPILKMRNSMGALPLFVAPISVAVINNHPGAG
jgi:hypothetical protein